MTAMLDAIGRFVTGIGENLAAVAETDRPRTAICRLMTDDHGNASQEWTQEAVRG